MKNSVVGETVMNWPQVKSERIKVINEDEVAANLLEKFYYGKTPLIFLALAILPIATI